MGRAGSELLPRRRFRAYAESEEPSAAKPGPQMSVADLIASVMPAVVNVSTVIAPRPPMTRAAQDLTPRAVQPAAGRGARLPGSGFIIDAVRDHRHQPPRRRERRADHGHAVGSDTTLPATRIGRLSRADIALLRVKPAAAPADLELGDSSDLMIGEPVIAVGNPLGFSTR